MPKLVASPRPVPWPAAFVVKKGSKTCSITSGGMPTPESRTVMQIPGSSGVGPGTSSSAIDSARSMPSASR
jgi:hypothetical protein